MLDDDLYRLVVRARNRWRNSPGHVDERFIDEGTGKNNDPVLFANTSDKAGVTGYESDPFVSFSDPSLDNSSYGKNYQR